MAGRQRLLYLALFLLFTVAFAWRMQGVTEWPMPFHPMLQYENALNTRALWLQAKGDSATATQKAWLAGYQGRWKGVPIVECLAAAVYGMLDREAPGVAGIITSVIWMLSALIFFNLARRFLHSVAGAFAATCFLLLHTFTLVVSRSYQHESVALLGFVVAWWVVQRWDARASWKSALMVGCLSGIALLTKPGICWIPWCFVLLATLQHRHGWRKALSLHLMVCALVALVPSLLWMKFILTSDETHQWKWPLLLSPTWYSTTWLHLASVLGWLPTALLLLMPCRWLWVGDSRLCILLMGCIAYLALFNYACMTHDYYLIVFFPIAALAWGSSFRWYPLNMRTQYPRKCADIPEKRKAFRHWLMNTGSLAAFVNAAMGTLVLANLGWVMPALGNTYQSYLEAAPYRPLETQCQALGEQLGVGTQVIALTNDYAMPLRYFSGLHAQWWPTQGDLWYESLGGKQPKPASQRLTELLSQHHAHYFVITLADEFATQTELQEMLRAYQEVPTTLAGVRIFDLELKAGGRSQ